MNIGDGPSRPHAATGSDVPIVVMGVSGSGKSSVAAALARRIGADFVEADDYHSAENRAKMARATPLTDTDRAPWLDRVGRAIGEHTVQGRAVVVSCSALRRSYRDRLRSESGADLFFVELTGDEGTLARRLESRRDHFMPRALLDSQLATLEHLEGDEQGMTADFGQPIDRIVGTVIGNLRNASASPNRLSPI